MPKYIKLFETYNDYIAVKDELPLPNVSVCEENMDVAYYNPLETRLVAKINVTYTGSTKVLNVPTGFTAIEIDGIEQSSVTANYTFNTTGEHTVRYELADPTNICPGAFYCCYNLTNMVIPDSVTTISGGSFNGCSGLINVTLGNGLTTIGGSAFYGCYNLTNIVIPDSVSIIDGGSFLGCSNLTSCTIGNGVITIADGAFNNCIRLTSIDIPDSVTYIGNSAFYNCYSLSSCTIGSGVTSIGDGAFYNCNGLTSITSVRRTAPIIQSGTFQLVKTNGTLYVPSGSDGYNTWMGTGDYYLGKYGWTKVEQ